MALTSGRKSVLPARTTSGQHGGLRCKPDAAQRRPPRRSTKASRRCVQSGNLRAIFHDHAGAEKTYPRHDIGGDLGGSRLPIDPQADGDEGCGSNGHQYIGSESGIALSPLAFRPNQSRQHEGDDEADAKVEQFVCIEIRMMDTFGLSM